MSNRRLAGGTLASLAAIALAYACTLPATTGGGATGAEDASAADAGNDAETPDEADRLARRHIEVDAALTAGGTIINVTSPAATRGSHSAFCASVPPFFRAEQAMPMLIDTLSIFGIAITLV